MLRLFAAIPLPADIAGSLAKFQQPLPGAKWVDTADYHITLRFAGDVDNLVARELADFLRRIDVNAFQMRLAGFGAFGGNDPRVLWAGVEAGPELISLQRDVENAARASGLKPERQQFKPHVTIARLRHSRAEAVSRFLERHAGARSRTFLVDHFALYSAKPRTGGGPYVIEETFPLAGFHWPDHDDNEDFDGPHIGSAGALHHER